MLSRRIRKLCWDTNYVGWDGGQDEMWDKDGIVWCVERMTLMRHVKKVPKRCPYALEHVMEMQNAK